MDEVFEAAIELRGSISGEHGIGISKAKHMELELGTAAIDCMRKIKKALDPENILNPGKIFYERQDSV
jgi:glycolate oxidase